MRRIHALHEEMKSAGALVYTGGLHPPSTATVLRSNGNDVLITDGPCIEGKEHLGGFTIIQAPDLRRGIGVGSKARTCCDAPDRGAAISP